MGELINLNPVTEASLPPEMTRDTELALALLKALTLFPRSGSLGQFDANNSSITGPGGFMWLDGGITNLNLPPNVNTGIFVQLDPLNTYSETGKYLSQIFFSVSHRLFFRLRINGTWGAWREISTSVV